MQITGPRLAITFAAAIGIGSCIYTDGDLHPLQNDFDGNGDQVLSPEECEVLIRDVFPDDTTAFDYGQKHFNYGFKNNTYMSHLNYLRCVKSRHHSDETGEERIKRTIFRHDKNNDGIISKSEWKGFVEICMSAEKAMNFAKKVLDPKDPNDERSLRSLHTLVLEEKTPRTSSLRSSGKETSGRAFVHSRNQRPTAGQVKNLNTAVRAQVRRG